MFSIPVENAMGYVGVFFVVLGVLLILAGAKILNIEKISITPGTKTLIIGIIITIGGILFLFPEISESMASLNTGENPAPPISEVTNSEEISDPALAEEGVSNETFDSESSESINESEPESEPETGLPEPPVVPMAFVPEGDYNMGSSYHNDMAGIGPTHEVFVSDFYIDIYEVTNQHYRDCVMANVCKPPLFDSSSTRDSYYSDLDRYGNFPVIFVSWEDAARYCDWRGGRLPTEAEWEKAAGHDYQENITHTFPWGASDPDPVWVNYSGTDTTEVGSFEKGKSYFGAYDMAGNVYEWVFDVYDKEYYRNDPPYMNPSGPPPGSSDIHSARGGAWSTSIDAPGELWTFARFSFDKDTRRNDLGFRCVILESP